MIEDEDEQEHKDDAVTTRRVWSSLPLALSPLLSPLFAFSLDHITRPRASCMHSTHG